MEQLNKKGMDSHSPFVRPNNVIFHNERFRGGELILRCTPKEVKKIHKDINQLIDI